ncbi:hypothetical protein AMK26_32080 [Streptomyces sp. CB03234]|uniref:DUF5655 domain-containing protein n=1 Tax=Streptomyces sp. (strain CB03234) TaxID=1703937 RepID=UPI00076F325A|nr:DUF5655 domain-containing protein [Streptomyces sp. CB03234]AME18019.1 hypothetical protein [Streptomyces sp. CB03234]OKJ95202.1 hypothetical protein AMK26_32080 [Streptomyces sp. CB03234]
MVKPDEMMDKVTGTLKERTGRDVDAWVDLVRTSGPDPLDQNAVRNWLRTEHKLTKPVQWAISLEAARRAGWSEPSEDEQVDAQYSGRKAALRPVHDRVAELATALAADVEREIRSTYVAFTRARQFAAVAAATQTRVDLGLRFTDAPESARLTPAKGPGQSTHKIALTSPDEVDAEVEKLLRIAYEQNG